MSDQPHDRGDVFASIALGLAGPLLVILTVFTSGTVPLQIIAFGLILFGLLSYAGTAGFENHSSG